jgi:hypothetical protein
MFAGEVVDTLGRLAREAVPIAEVWEDTLAAALKALCPAPVTPPADVILPPGVPAPLTWHVDRLSDLARATPTAVTAARRRYHARMLGHTLAPARAEFRPLVTILLPVLDRAGPLIDAVQSCLDQTWRPIEILVIDDGSTDHPEQALARFGDLVRLVRKPNGGVASARNLGLRLAAGDFIQFLDSDDLLCPRAIEDKIAAYRAVPNADLCYGQTHWVEMRRDPPVHHPIETRALANPRRTMIVDFAFMVPSVMMPRWRMLAMPPFEEDLTRASDFRFWQKLAFAGITVIGLRSEVAILRRFEHSLQTTPHPQDDSHPLCLLRSLVDLVHCAETWPYVHEYMGLMVHPRYRHCFTNAPSARLRPVLATLSALLETGYMPTGTGNLSLLPIAAAMRSRIRKLQREGLWPTQYQISDCLYAALDHLTAQAVARATPLGAVDIAFWVRPPDRLHRDGRLERLFAAIAARCRPQPAARLADTLLRHASDLPNRRTARYGTRLLPFIGPRLAGKLAARRMKLA